MSVYQCCAEVSCVRIYIHVCISVCQCVSACIMNVSAFFIKLVYHMYHTCITLYHAVSRSVHINVQ